MSTKAAKNTCPSGLILRGNTFHMRFTVKGIPVAESCYTSNLREATRIMERRRSELVQQVVLGKQKPIKLHTAIATFLSSRAHMPSVHMATNSLKPFLALPNTFVNHIAHRDLEEAIEKRRAEGVKESVVKASVTYFNALINYLTERDYVVCKKLDNNIKIKGRIRILTLEEEQRFFAAIDPNAMYIGKNATKDKQRQTNADIATLLLHTGARSSEIFEMKWDQVNLINDTVLIKRNKDGVDSTLLITSKMKEVFVRRKAERDAIPKAHIDPANEFVINDKANSAHGTTWVGLAVKRAGLYNKDNNVSLHTLRHTRASRWIAGGMNPVEVQHLLGHKELASTMVYVHLNASQTATKASAITEAE